MPILKRRNKYQGLKDLDILQEESGLSSQYFNVVDFPSTIPKGASSFIIAGSHFLKENVELKIEVLDSAGNPVYTEAIPHYLEGNARRVSIEVYDDTAPGDGFLYVVGELKDGFVDDTTPNNEFGINSINTTSPFDDQLNALKQQAKAGVDVINEIQELEDLKNQRIATLTQTSIQSIPPAFQGVYNVRYVRPIFINSTVPNTQPIIFHGAPRVTVKEIVKGFVNNSTADTTVTITGSADIENTPDGTEILPKDNEPVDDFPAQPNIEELDSVTKQIERFKNNRKSKIEVIRRPHLSTRGRIVKRASPEIEKSNIKISELESGTENDSNKASSALVGADVTINSPAVDTTKFPTDEFTIPDTFTTKVKKVKNSSVVEPEDQFFVTNKSTGEKHPADILDCVVTMSYQPAPQQSISTSHFRSFADITVGNLRTFSGDVYKSKIYARSKGTLGDFEPIYETPIESPQMLIDPFSTTGFANTGYFYTQSIIDDYWLINSGTKTQNDDYLIDGMLVSGSNRGINDVVTLTSSQSIELEYGVPYTLQFNSYYLKEEKLTSEEDVSNSAILKVYLSGSAISGDGGEEDHFLGEVNIPQSSAVEGKIDNIYNTFISSKTGDPKTQLIFKVEAGRFVISDVMLRPYSETNFNPEFFRAIVPMPHPMPKKPDNYDFLVEFFDTDSNIAETIAITENVLFEGASFNIDGDGNLLSGSMYMGSVEGSGIELHGGSAYMRSLGYNGFDRTIAENKGGFLIFSGSVSQSLSTSQSYDGVGLELVDAHGSTDRYLRFRTNPSLFEVVTDTFFLGSETGAFVSGSGGNIEISSSNFHLTNTGDVTMSGVITATAGNIGDWNIVDGKLSGSNITMDATTSTIYKTDQGPGTDSAAAFDQLRDEYYIDFTPTTENPDNYYIKMGPMFMVDKDGILIASGATFEGSITASAGMIGGFQTDSSSFHSQNIFISGSPTPTGTYTHLNQDQYMFISTSNFNVKESGDVTGSNVLFSGGRIANWDIDGDTLSSVNASGKGIILDADNSTPIIEIKEDSNNKLELYHTTSTNWGIIGKSGGTNLFRLGSTNEIAGWAISGSYISKAISGSVAHQDFTRVYMSSVNDNTQNITEGFSVYRKDEDLQDGEVKVVRLGGLSDTTNLHANNEYGLQIIKKDSNNNYSNILYIGPTTQSISNWNITTSGFHNDAGTVELSSTQASMSLGSGNEVVIRGNSNSPFISLQPAEAIADKTYGGSGIFLGVSGGSTPLFSAVSGSNHLKFNGTGIEIKTSDFHVDTSTFDVSTNYGGSIKLGSSPSMTANGIFLSGSGEFNFQQDAKNYIRFDDVNKLDVKSEKFGLDAGTLKISSSLNNGSIALGVTPPIAYNSGNGFYVDGNERFLLGSSTGSRIQFDGSTFTVSSSAFELNTDTIDISSGNERIQVFDDSGNEYVRIGEISDSDGSDDYGMKIYDGSGTADGNTLVKFGEEGNRIAGWSIDGSNIFSTNLFLRSAGTIETADFASNVRGWRISAAGNGTAEFENARIRGTLSTAVFEKETVNAVGGQLYVANSTSITGSAGVTASQETMSVVNATGFTGSYNNDGEVISIKKVTTTGFQTEYVLVQSASRDFPSSETNFAGKLYVKRGYSGSSATHSGSEAAFVGDIQSTPSNYEEGQVLVSTGRSGSGYIRLNANPNDTTTPYIDIVERTGSNIYDVDLKARVGDLSGVNVSEFAEFGILPADAGFGIYTSNGYFTGGITATTGSITGKLFVHTGVGASNKIIIGTDVQDDGSGTNDGMWINTHNYWYTTGQFKVGSGTNFLSHDGSGDIQIQSQKFELDATDLHISSTQASMSLGHDSDPSNDGGIKIKGSAGGSVGLGGVIPTTLLSNGIFMSGSGEFNFQRNSTNYLRFANNRLDVRTSDIGINSTGLKMIASSSGENSIGLGSATTFGQAGIFMSGSGGISIYKDSTNYLMMTGSTFDIAASNITLSGSGINLLTENFYFGSATNYISGSSSGIAIKTGEFEVDASGIEISSAQQSMSLGSSNQINLDGNGGTGGVPKITLLGGEIESTGSAGRFFVDTAGGISASAILISDNLSVDTSQVYNFGDGNYNSYFFGRNDAMRIVTADFNLTTSNLIMSSSNNGVISLGSTPPVSATSGNGIFLKGDGTFLVGNTSGNYINYSGGTFTLKPSHIDLETTGTNKVKLDSTGTYPEFALGATLNSSVGGTNKGIYMNGSGSFLVRGDANNLLKLDASSNTLQLKSDTFQLDASTIVMDSATNNGKIALGQTPPTAYNSGNGFYTDGQGRLLAGSSTGSKIQWDGSTLVVSSSDFYLGGGGQFVSGSGGNIEISSSNFHLTNTGTITATGAINANTGTFGGTSNGWTIPTGKLHNAGASGTNDFIGLVHSSQAHADVGVQSAFYAGADANTGEDARISFGSDGKIRGTGVYVRNQKEFLISAETIFGGGEDGDLRIDSHGVGGTMQIWTDGFTSSASASLSDGNVGKVYSPGYKDHIMTKYEANDGRYIRLERDVYLKRLILGIDDGDIKVHMNGYRLFASEGIFIYSDSGGSSNYVLFFENASSGGTGGNGTDGLSDRNGTAYQALANATAGTAGTGGSGRTGGTLVGLQAGGAGGAGGTGGGVSVDLSSGNPGTPSANTPGTGTTPATSSLATDGLSTVHPMISTLTGRAGVKGGNGGQSSEGGGGNSSAAAASSPSVVQGGIQYLSTPADSIIKVRAEFGNNDYAIRLTTSPTNSGGTGGGGGKGDSADEGIGEAANRYATFAGGAGGGGGGAGSNGGIVLISAKVIDWWNTSIYSTTVPTLGVQSPGSNTGGHGRCKLQAVGGNGGNGGNGGAGGGLGLS